MKLYRQRDGSRQEACRKCGRTDHDLADRYADGSLCTPDGRRRTGYWVASDGTVQPVYALEAGTEHAAQYTAERDPHSARTDALVVLASDERPVYAWVAEGGVATGSLVGYTGDVRMAHYSGFSVSDIVTLLSIEGHAMVQATRFVVEYAGQGTSMDAEGYPSYRHTRIVVRDPDGVITDAADFTIDLRA